MKYKILAKYSHPECGLNPPRNLIEGREYEVEDISIGQSYTSVCLKGVSDCYNSVNFDFFEDGKEIDIFKDPRFNLYMRGN